MIERTFSVIVTGSLVVCNNISLKSKIKEIKHELIKRYLTIMPIIINSISLCRNMQYIRSFQS